MCGDPLNNDLGITLKHRYNTNGSLKPHITVSFSHEGRTLDFGVDTTRSRRKDENPDAFLITHAHGDHHGKSAMLSPDAYASFHTVDALEIRYDREYQGRCFEVGTPVDIHGVRVETYSTRHAIGSSAFYWENEVGARILVTGDVKDYTGLPECDVLITEANYGDPTDPSCQFEDDLDGLRRVVESPGPVALGAYAFGKAQRAVHLLRINGYHDNIAMEERSLALTRQLLEGAEPLSSLNGAGDLIIVPPWDLKKLSWSLDKYVLTGMPVSHYGKIQISDHLDSSGIIGMVRHCSPEMVIFYHPDGGDRTRIMAETIEQDLGIKAIASK